jgi:hypothetical protein
MDDIKNLDCLPGRERLTKAAATPRGAAGEE